MICMPVEVDLPPQGVLKHSYSEVTCRYYLAQWTPSRGWLDQYEEPLACITHWFDIEIPLPFPISDKFDRAAAKKYGFRLSEKSDSSED